ncbi:unnamed protein product [Arctia plantaginis]|uniref:Defensin n=1 Tax=Arctia plantaginis TaxID=874455 RepID=A0A8S0ZDS3_ARCPL|nr:unnamed protein product [Arctia plantaginis]
MGIAKKIQVIILIVALSAYCTQITAGNSIGVIENEEASENYVSISRSNSEDSSIAHGRIYCDFEEPTETAVCQEHCLPKGYSYGICVSRTCSCI